MELTQSRNQSQNEASYGNKASERGLTADLHALPYKFHITMQIYLSLSDRGPAPVNI